MSLVPTYIKKCSQICNSDVVRLFFRWWKNLFDPDIYTPHCMSEMQAENCLERKENEGLGLLAWEGRHLIHQNERGEKFNSSLYTFCTVFALDKTGHMASKGFYQRYVLLKSESIREKCRLRRICTFYLSLHCSKMTGSEVIQLRYIEWNIVLNVNCVASSLQNGGF